GLPAGDHRRLDRPEAACPRPVHGRREVGNPRRGECVGEGMTAISPMPYTAPSPACSVAELIQRVQAGASGLGYQVSPTPDGFVMVAHRNAQVIAGSGTIQVTHHVRLDEVTKTYSVTDEVRETGLGSFSFTRTGSGSSKSIANSSTSRGRVSKKV